MLFRQIANNRIQRFPHARGECKIRCFLSAEGGSASGGKIKCFFCAVFLTRDPSSRAKLVTGRDGRQLKKIPDENNLQTAERFVLPSNFSTYGINHRERSRRQH